jgi:hypothetical protein
MKTQCARCGAELLCDPAGDCWCKKLPHARMPARENAVACLCPDCLARELRAQGLEAADGDAHGRDH